MDRISSSIPFPASISQVARAYGVRPAAVAQPAAQTEPLARIGQPKPAGPASDPARLVAAQVGTIDLARDVAQIAGRPTDAMQLYRHPADRNQAATAVALGRSLDIKA